MRTTRSILAKETECESNENIYNTIEMYAAHRRRQVNTIITHTAHCGRSLLSIRNWNRICVPYQCVAVGCQIVQYILH